MQTIVLEQQSVDGKRLQATFAPECGMNLLSFKKGDVEVIDQSTRHLFDERFAGLGALIGPHFHRRRAQSVPPVKDESLFPHIARVKAKGVQDPFSHGIGRYAPWKADVSGNQIKATLSGKDTWNGVPLAELEGQSFKMEFDAGLKPNGLFLRLSVVSDTDSLVGIHYYYALPGGTGKVLSDVRNQKEGLSQAHDAKHRLIFDLSQEVDDTFRPYFNPLEGTIILETESYCLRTHYQCDSEENCWQLYHPLGASFVCIEPISAQDPRHPNLSTSSLTIHLEIDPPSS